jgi:serine/threonine protein phosphatase PrpC
VSPTVFAAVTHVGRVRTNNEDAWGTGDELWVVADGMGGHAGGEIASRLAVETLLAAAPTDSDAFRVAFTAAHQAVVDASTDELAGMGTTLVAAAREAGGDVLLGSVGDSRGYLWDGRSLNRLTTDDNEAEVLLSEGSITAEEARTHPGQFYLTASLGSWRSQAPEPHLLRVPAHAGRLLLCSDGLNGELDDDQIAAGLAGGSPEEAAERLAGAAVDAGGRDNVTVLVIDL